MAKEYKSYWEKLRDPRWQRKRLEVMQKNDFKCQNCKDVLNIDSDDLTLNVHHAWYEKIDPWEYEEECYQCLCEPCHKIAEKARLEISKMLFIHYPEELRQIAEWLSILQKTQFEHGGCGGLMELFGYIKAQAELVAEGSGKWLKLELTDERLG